MPTGIYTRHRKNCASRNGRRCNCEPTYQAWVVNKRTKKRVRKHFADLAAAKAWREDALVALRKGEFAAPSRQTIKQAAELWLTGARDGAIRNRSGHPYKPSALRGYEQALTLRVLPDLGDVLLSDLQRTDVQAFVDRLVGRGLGASTIRNTLLPLRAIYRHALRRGVVTVNPTAGVELPAVRGRRERIATPQEAGALIGAAPASDRAIWATAFYAGLRLGELRALRWEDVDLAAGVIRVRRSWDHQEGEISTKSTAGERSVPIPAVLRDELLEHRMGQTEQPALVFPSDRKRERPFDPTTIGDRADRGWEARNASERENAAREDRDPWLLDRITLHECRHTFASLMIAAGVNAKALSTYMGHSSITITLDRYGHLMPGNEEHAAELLDAYLAANADVARAAEPAPVAEPGAVTA